MRTVHNSAQAEDDDTRTGNRAVRALLNGPFVRGGRSANVQLPSIAGRSVVHVGNPAAVPATPADCRSDRRAGPWAGSVGPRRHGPAGGHDAADRVDRAGRAQPERQSPSIAGPSVVDVGNPAARAASPAERERGRRRGWEAGADTERRRRGGGGDGATETGWGRRWSDGDGADRALVRGVPVAGFPCQEVRLLRWDDSGRTPAPHTGSADRSLNPPLPCRSWSP